MSSYVEVWQIVASHACGWTKDDGCERCGAQTPVQVLNLCGAARRKPVFPRRYRGRHRPVE